LGHQGKSLQLFLKISLLIAEKIAVSGCVVALRTENPSNHMTEGVRWDYGVTIIWKNFTLATMANPDEDSPIHQIYRKRLVLAVCTS
jgi:hypothetical protein